MITVGDSIDSNYLDTDEKRIGELEVRAQEVMQQNIKGRIEQTNKQTNKQTNWGCRAGSSGLEPWLFFQRT